MQLLEHFKEVTKHPKNAEELKGLILQLAIQGKLTQKWREENPDVEPAEKLLDRIKKYNAENLTKKGRRTKPEKVELEVKLDLPSKWIQVRNKDLLTLQKGKNPNDLSETVKTYPYQDIEALDRGNVRRYSDDEKAPRCTDEDILVVCDGSRSGLVLDGKSGIVGSTLAIIETPPFIKKYIKIIFQQDYQRANSNMIGAAIPHLDTKNLLSEVIGLPPLAEQKAILAVVNQLFAEVEQLENLTKKRIQLKTAFVTSALNQLTQATESEVASHWELIKSQFGTFFTEKENIKKLREAVLQLAVQGKLTHHWRSQRKLSTRLPDGQGIEVEPASVLLEKIKAEKDQLIKAGKIKKEKPLPPISKEEIPYELPEGWVWCRLGKVTNSFSTGPFGSMLHKDDYVVDGTPVINPQQMVNGKIVPSKKMQVSDTTKSRLFRYVLKEGNFIIARRGEMGRCAIVTNKEDGFLCGTGSFFLDLAFEINREFIYLLFQSEFVREYLKSSSNGATMSNLNQSIVLNMSIPLPPVEEQIVIVEKVNGLMALCDELEKEIETYQTTQEEWMQSCLREVVEK